MAASRQDSWKLTSPSVLCGQLEIAGEKPSSAQARSLMSLMVLLDGWRLPFSVLLLPSLYSFIMSFATGLLHARRGRFTGGLSQPPLILLLLLLLLLLPVVALRSGGGASSKITSFTAMKRPSGRRLA